MGPTEDLKRLETELSAFSPEAIAELSGDRKSFGDAVRAQAFIYPEGMDEKEALRRQVELFPGA